MSGKLDIRTKEFKKIKSIAIELQKILNEELYGFSTDFTQRIINICNEDIPYKELLEDIEKEKESKVFWKNYHLLYKKDDGFRKKADFLFSCLIKNNPFLCSYCGKRIIKDNQFHKGVLQIGTGVNKSLRGFCNREHYKLFFDKLISPKGDKK